jgi:hypothetical protein
MKVNAKIYFRKNSPKNKYLKTLIHFSVAFFMFNGSRIQCLRLIFTVFLLCILLKGQRYSAGVLWGRALEVMV